MKKIVTAIAALFAVLGFFSCVNPSNMDDEKKNDKAVVKINVPDDGIDEYSFGVPYLYKVYISENGVEKFENNGIPYGMKPGSSLKFKSNKNTLFSLRVQLFDKNMYNAMGEGAYYFYIKKGESVNCTINAVDVSTLGETKYKILFNNKETNDNLKLLNYFPRSSYGTDGTAGKEWPYVEFGEWPQTLVGNINKVNTSISEVHGMFTYYRYDEDEWCVEAGGTYFLVEPIKWRILNKDEYAKTGKALLLAEKILTTLKYYDLPQNRQSGVYASNYESSRVRAFLNGLQYEGHYGESIEDFNDGTNAIGFLQTAFTKKQISKILDTNVDNSELSTTDHNQTLQPATGYTCNNTLDKIFLLSFNEASNEDYGFGVFNDTDSKRKRIYTDYATQIQQGLTGNPVYVGPGEWMLRSPYASYIKAHYVETDGSSNASSNVVAAPLGCVPALWVEL